MLYIAKDASNSTKVKQDEKDGEVKNKTKNNKNETDNADNGEASEEEENKKKNDAKSTKNNVNKKNTKTEKKDADDEEKDDEKEPSGKPLGEIAKINKYITNTRVEILQTLYTVRDVQISFISHLKKQTKDH